MHSGGTFMTATAAAGRNFLFREVAHKGGRVRDVLKAACLVEGIDLNQPVPEL